MRIPWLGSLLLPAILGVVQVLGISQRDAGLHDWHMELVGVPAIETGTGPRFHYPAGPSNTASSSLVYTATQKNVLAALDPKTGIIGKLGEKEGLAFGSVHDQGGRFVQSDDAVSHTVLITTLRCDYSLETCFPRVSTYSALRAAWRL